MTLVAAFTKSHSGSVAAVVQDRKSTETKI